MLHVEDMLSCFMNQPNKLFRLLASQHQNYPSEYLDNCSHWQTQIKRHFNSVHLPLNILQYTQLMPTQVKQPQQRNWSWISVQWWRNLQRSYRNTSWSTRNTFQWWNWCQRKVQVWIFDKVRSLELRKTKIQAKEIWLKWCI